MIQWHRRGSSPAELDYELITELSILGILDSGRWATIPGRSAIQKLSRNGVVGSEGLKQVVGYSEVVLPIFAGFNKTVDWINALARLEPPS